MDAINPANAGVQVAAGCRLEIGDCAEVGDDFTTPQGAPITYTALGDSLWGGTASHQPRQIKGELDPSAGGGVAAPQGSIYQRYNVGGQAWLKTGAADTAWGQLVPGGGPDADFYQTVTRNIVTVLPQRNNLNFTTDFTVTDDAGNNATTIGLSVSPSSVTLQQAYTNGGAGPQVVAYSPAGLGVLLRDNAAPIAGTLFGVQSSGGASTYFDVDATRVSSGVNGFRADSGLVKGFVDALGEAGIQQNNAGAALPDVTLFGGPTNPLTQSVGMASALALNSTRTDFVLWASGGLGVGFGVRTTGALFSVGDGGAPYNAKFLVDFLGGVTISQTTLAGPAPAGGYGAPTAFRILGASATALAASTPVQTASIQLGDKQWSTGALAQQNDFLIIPGTYSFVGASVIGIASSFCVSGPPTLGANATATNLYSVNVSTGLTNLGGGFEMPDNNPGLSPSNTGRMRYHSASQTFQVSLNGAAYVDISTGGGSETLQQAYTAGGGGTAGTITATAAGGQFSWTAGAASSGATTDFTFVGAAHTNQTLSTEVVFVNWNLAQTVQWATGNFATERVWRVQAPTLSAVGASTITTAATFEISGPPAAGTNMTITNAYPLWIESGRILINTSATSGWVTSGATFNDGMYVNHSAQSSAVILNGAGGEVVFFSGSDPLGQNHAGLAMVGTTTDFRMYSNGAVRWNWVASSGAYTSQNVNSVIVSGDGSSSTYSYGFTGGDGIFRTSGGGVSFGIGGTSTISAWNSHGNQSATPTASTSGAPIAYTLTDPANTGITTTVEVPSVKYDLSSTKQWASGNFANQRQFQILAPTLSATAATTITNASTFYVSAAPSAGTNMTLTNKWSAWFGATIRVDSAQALGGGATATLGTVGGSGRPRPAERHAHHPHGALGPSRHLEVRRSRGHQHAEQRADGREPQHLEHQLLPRRGRQQLEGALPLLRTENVQTPHPGRSVRRSGAKDSDLPRDVTRSSFYTRSVSRADRKLRRHKERTMARYVFIHEPITLLNEDDEPLKKHVPRCPGGACACPEEAPIAMYRWFTTNCLPVGLTGQPPVKVGPGKAFGDGDKAARAIAHIKKALKTTEPGAYAALEHADWVLWKKCCEEGDWLPGVSAQFLAFIDAVLDAKETAPPPKVVEAAAAVAPAPSASTNGERAPV